MKSYARYYLGVLSVLILTMPAWAGSKPSHKDSTDYDVTQEMMVGKTQLQPGHYTINAREFENQFDILRDGKVIATVPCQWVRLPKKAEQSEISSTGDHVNEVEFGGRNEAVKVG
ncbi:MAG TPA: hypothetical protein VLY23_02670 [Candidatus Acidoferrum sp.]|nr:hypothetical protein [Candidatus Acidoferrum sp.]